jgi:hypothetical protein
MTKERKEMVGGLAALAAVGVLVYLFSGYKIGPAVDRHACKDCRGTGQTSMACWTCSGRGYVGGAKCTACSASGRTEQVCRFCAGSGRKP